MPNHLKRIEKKFLIISVIIVLLIIPNFQNYSFAEDNICAWENINIENYMLERFSQKDNLNAIQCDLGKQNLRDIIIQIHFRFVADNNQDWIFVISNSAGTNSISKPIMSWYDIEKDEAHIAIDVKDFDTNHIRNKISNFQIVTDNPNGIEIIKTELIKIEPFENFEIWENIPIQNPIFALVGIFAISFPPGYIVINKFNLLPNKNFFFSFPWYISIGLAISLIIIFFISIFWISFESILTFLIIEYIILFYYLNKNKSKKLNFDKTSMFFLLVFGVSIILPITYSQIDGWAPGTGDARNHLLWATNIIENQTVLKANNPIIAGFESSSTTLIYPLGAHSMIAGISILTNSFPGATMFALSILVKILIPMLAITIVFWHTRSFILSTIMLMAGFLNFEFSGYMSAHIGSDVGILLLLTSLIAFLNFNNPKIKKIPIILILIITLALSVVFYPFTGLLIILFVVLSPYFIKKLKNKILLYSGFTIIFFVGVFIARTLFNRYLSNKAIPYLHEKYLNHPFFNFEQISPGFVGSMIGFLSSIYLLFDYRFRIISVVSIVVFLIHVLSLSEDIVSNYLFFYKALRSIELMEIMSQIMILLFIFKMLEISKIQNWFKNLPKMNLKLLKALILGFGILLLIPSISVHLEEIEKTPKRLTGIPGGNEAKIYFWLMENSNQEDLILNDHSSAAQSFEAFRFQKVVNNKQTNTFMQSIYNPETGFFEPNNKISTKINQANLILKSPWNYEYIKNTLSEFNIKYVYISEREDLFHKSSLKDFKENTYPNSKNWSWKDYSGNARIVMYEQHPNLELILRFGNSALFKVIGS